MTDQPIKRLTPAGQPYPENHWVVPTLEHREAWLSDARGVWHANKDKTSIVAWHRGINAARIISLLALVDRLEQERDGLRQQRDDATSGGMTDAEILKDCEGRLDYRRAEAESLRQQLAEAEAEIRRLNDRAQANAQIFKGEQDTLKLALGHLEKLWALAQDADNDFNFSEEGIP